MDSKPEVDTQLDARGLYCPEPVMLLHNKIADMQAGQVVEILATDPSTQRDIPRFCSFLGHQLIDQKINETDFIFWVRKAF